MYIHTSRCTCTTCIRVDVHVHVDALNSSHVAAEVRVLSQQLREALVVGCNTSVQGHDLCHKVSQCRQRRMPENKYTRDAPYNRVRVLHCLIHRKSSGWKLSFSSLGCCYIKTILSNCPPLGTPYDAVAHVTPCDCCGGFCGAVLSSA